METGTEHALETQFLNQTISTLKERIAELERLCVSQSVRVKELYDQYTPADPQYYMDIPVAEMLLNGYKNDLADYKRVFGVPYFGKVRFRDHDEPAETTLYIGKKGVHEFEDKEIPIIDWRAPVSDVYYSCKLGDTSYHGAIKEIPIELFLKRTLKIRDGCLDNFYDAEVAADDELLLEYLSQNKGLVLNEIVATIQDEQNAIIRKSLYKNLVVQGVAGSGKTTVAIHRISYLLYSFRDQLTFDNVFLIAENPLFLSYITAMLPDLDVPAVQQQTMQRLIADEFLKKAKALSKRTTREVGPPAPIYRNETFLPAFEAFFRSVIDKAFPLPEGAGLTLLSNLLLAREHFERARRNDRTSLLERAHVLDAVLTNNLVRDKLRIIDSLLLYKDTPEGAKALEAIYHISPEKAFEDFLVENYGRVRAYYRGYFTKRIKKLRCKDLLDSFLDETVKTYTRNDCACFLLLHYRIFGALEYPQILQVVIDEAQDFSVVMYSFLRALFPNATFTVVGDIMQSIRPDGLDRWEDLEAILQPNYEALKLLKSYRNTYEISAFAQKVVERMTGSSFQLEPLKRHGAPVLCLEEQGNEGKRDDLWKVLRENQSKNCRLNAIICLDSKKLAPLQTFLGAYGEISILDETAAGLEFGNYLVDIQNAKGLEFDSVILWDFDDYKNEAYKLLYVAMSRALHHLTVFTNSPEVKAYSILE